MATAAELTIVEVEEFVELGELNPDEIVTPGIYVDRVVLGTEFQKPIEGRFLKQHVSPQRSYGAKDNRERKRADCKTYRQGN